MAILSLLETVFTDRFPVKKCLFVHASLETGNPCIEITSHRFSIPFFYSFLDLRYFALLSNTNQSRTKCDIYTEADFNVIGNKSILFEIKVEQFTVRNFVKSMSVLLISFYMFNVDYLRK